MIYYFDIHKTAVFHEVFRSSGVVHKNPYRGVVGMYALRNPLLYRLPSCLFFPRPVFKGGDDKIILFDTYSSSRLINWLSKKWPDKRIIIWYWNSVKTSGLKTQLPARAEYWSFSKTDCEENGFKYNTQFFFDSLASEAAESRERGLSQHPRALFLGRDKGRLKILEDLKDGLEREGVEVDLKITMAFSGRFGFFRESLLPYGKVIDFVKDADILLDYTTNPQTGLSLRAMEALFFGKKLITNNLEILESDFYSPANIYVLDHDKRSLKEFLDCQVELVAPEIRDRYLLSNWLKRFD